MRISTSDPHLPAIERGEPFRLTVDGQPVTGYAGETVATVLLAAGRRIFRHTPHQQQRRGLFCGMGLCYDCLVTIDGTPHQRACLVRAAAGMRIETGEAQSPLAEAER
jgi:aerobic-type carbon monoxide dehydrogenase small subunit (CoxS/CutS family)